jgi:hypothetical protein
VNKSVAFIVIAFTLLAGRSLAATYNFVNIADNSGPFSTFTDNPALNSSRVVAFHANFDAGGSGAYTGMGGALTTIADASNSYSSISWVDINDSGAVAFYGHPTTGNAGIFRSDGNGTPITTINAIGGVYSSIYTPISMNNAGVVIFGAERTDNAGIRGIYAGSGGAITPVVESTSGLDTKPGSTMPNINNAGTVAFNANLFTPSEAIYTRTAAGVVAPIAAVSGPYKSAMDNHPSISDNGTVTFLSTLDDNSQGLFMGNGGPVTTIGTTAGPYSGFINSAINSSDQFVFFAGVDTSQGGGRGLFTGPNPATDKIIRTGDALFGSTLTDMEFFHGLNDNGDVAFKYILANGQQGIALATVPEPASLSLLGLMLIAARRARKK